MPITPTASDLSFICREANLAAGRIVRRLGLPIHERDDVRQDLLLDLIARLPAFDVARGSLGAFAQTVFAHRACRIARNVVRERRLFGRERVSTDDPIAAACGTSRGDLFAEEDGLPVLLGQPVNDAATVERRLDAERAFATLPHAEIAFCATLKNATPTELSRSGGGGRSGVYRRIANLRLALTAAGLAA